MPSTTTPYVTIEDYLLVVDSNNKRWKHSNTKQTFTQTSVAPHNLSIIWTGDIILGSAQDFGSPFDIGYTRLDLRALPTDADDLNLTGCRIQVVQVLSSVDNTEYGLRFGEGDFANRSDSTTYILGGSSSIVRPGQLMMRQVAGTANTVSTYEWYYLNFSSVLVDENNGGVGEVFTVRIVAAQ